MGVSNTESAHYRPWTRASRCVRDLTTTSSCKETQTGEQSQPRPTLEHNTHTTGCPCTLLQHGHPFAHQSQCHASNTTPAPARVVACYLAPSPELLSSRQPTVSPLHARHHEYRTPIAVSHTTTSRVTTGKSNSVSRLPPFPCLFPKTTETFRKSFFLDELFKKKSLPPQGAK